MGGVEEKDEGFGVGVGNNNNFSLSDFAVRVTVKF